MRALAWWAGCLGLGAVGAMWIAVIVAFGACDGYDCGDYGRGGMIGGLLVSAVVVPVSAGLLVLGRERGRGPAPFRGWVRSIALGAGALAALPAAVLLVVAVVALFTSSGLDGPGTALFFGGLCAMVAVPLLLAARRMGRPVNRRGSREP